MGMVVPRNFYNKIEMVYTGSCCLGIAKRRYSQAESLFSPRMTPELREELLESIVLWTVPSEELSTDQQRAAWSVDSSASVNGHLVWKAITLSKEEKKQSALELNCMLLS